MIAAIVEGLIAAACRQYLRTEIALVPIEACSIVTLDQIAPKPRAVRHAANVVVIAHDYPDLARKGWTLSNRAARAAVGLS